MESKRGQRGIFIVIGVLAIALVGGYFIFFSGSDNQNNIPDNNVKSNNKNTIEITSSGFSPKTMTISRGEAVTFVNQKSTSAWPASDIHPTHTLYDGTSLSEHCQDGSESSFDACEGLSSEETYEFTFDKTGEWKYHDHLNPSDTGTIIVQ